MRALGYAVDNEEGEVGARCVGAPIFDYLNQVIAAISISGPSGRIAEEQLPQLGIIVREVALRASALSPWEGGKGNEPSYAITK